MDDLRMSGADGGQSEIGCGEFGSEHTLPSMATAGTPLKKPNANSLLCPETTPASIPNVINNTIQRKMTHQCSFRTQEAYRKELSPHLRKILPSRSNQIHTRFQPEASLTFLEARSSRHLRSE
jgi:hypothetical protein